MVEIPREVMLRVPSPGLVARGRLPLILVAAYVAIALCYVGSVPVWEATDEAGHFAYVKYLRDRLALPYQPADPRQLVLSHWFHPPLYHAVGALTTAWIDVSDYPESTRANPHFQWVQGDGPGGWNVYLPVEQGSFPPGGTVLAVYLLRLLSVAMCAGVVVIAFKLGDLLLPRHPAIALGAAALTAFNPAFIYMSSGVHNDNLAALLGSAVVLWSVRIVVGPPPNRRMLAIGGALLGLALLAKTSELTLAPVAAAAAGASALRSDPVRPSEGRVRLLALNRSALRAWLPRVLGASALTLGCAGLVAGWWYGRNVLLYGDPLAWQRYTTTHAFLVRSQVYDLQAFRGFLAQLARTYWAAFGYMNLTVDRPIYYALWSASLVACLGVIRLIRGGQVWLDVRERWPGWMLAIAALILYLASLVRYSATLGGVGHGRLVFPVIAVASLVLATGFYQLPPRTLAGPLLCVAVLSLAGLSATCPFVYIRPAYAIPQPVPDSSVPALAGTTVTFGDKLRLVGLQVSPERVRPGGRIRVWLYWQAVASGGPDLLVNVRLRDREGTTLFQVERRPLKGHLPTDLWRAGDTYEDVYDVLVPRNAYTGRSPVEVGVRHPNGEYLTARDSQGRVPGTSTVVSQVAIVATRERGWEKGSQTVPGTGRPLGVVLGNRVRLLGFDLDSTTARPGGALRFVLYWETQEPILDNYTVFTHMADDSGRPVAQRDAEPLDRAYPTSVWRVGEVIRDPYVIAIPSDVSPGQYQLLVGMYVHATGARLPVDLAGASGDEDCVELGRVTVGK